MDWTDECTASIYAWYASPDIVFKYPDRPDEECAINPALEAFEGKCEEQWETLFD